ncbi:hypothetical protein [Rhodococcus sp. NPDC056516]|uniref:hypothetical protein n=1 Tax=Rhodococcus sp. NPDC056516 TaxID=3345847 RepID=UPI00366EF8CF
MPDPFAIEVDSFYNTIVLRSPDDYEPLAPGWFPTEPQFVTGGPGRLVIHTGGRGLVRVTVTSTETPAPPLTDSLLTVWEDIAESSFTIESDALCFDGFSGEVSHPIPHPRPGPCRVRVFARGRTEYWDAYRTPETQPQIRLHIQLWPQQLGDPHLIQYRGRITGNRSRTDDTPEEKQPTTT